MNLPPPANPNSPRVQPMPLPETWNFATAHDETNNIDFLVVQIQSPGGVDVHFLPTDFAHTVIERMTTALGEHPRIKPASLSDIARLDEHRHNT